MAKPDIVDMAAPRSARVPSQRTGGDVIDLHVRRMGGEQVVRATASAPIKYLPAALLDALEGSWGTPEELGLRRKPERHLRLVAS